METLLECRAENHIVITEREITVNGEPIDLRHGSVHRKMFVQNKDYAAVVIKDYNYALPVFDDVPTAFFPVIDGIFVIEKNTGECYCSQVKYFAASNIETGMENITKIFFSPENPEHLCFEVGSVKGHIDCGKVFDKRICQSFLTASCYGGLQMFSLL